MDLAGDQRLEETQDGGVRIIDPTPDATPEAPEPRTAPVDEAKLAALKAAGEVSADAALPDPQAYEKSRQLADEAGVAGPDDHDALPVPQLPERRQPAAEPAMRAADAVAEGAALAAEVLRDAELRIEQRVEAEIKALDIEQDERNEALRDAARDAKTGAADDAVVVATIKPAWAIDADGNDVPTELSVDGETVTMTVEHRDGDFAYPIVADPWVVVEEVSLEWACCLPVYQWQWLFSHKDANWHHAGDWFTTALIDGFYDYGWGPSRGWWGWHNVELPGIWLTMPYWSWGPMYYLEWYPVHTWQQVLVGWAPYLRWATTTSAYWEDDLEWAEAGPEPSSGLFVDEDSAWDADDGGHAPRALPALIGLGGVCARYCDDAYRVFTRIRKVKPSKIKHPKPNAVNQQRAISFTQKAGSNPSRTLGDNLGRAKDMRKLGYCAHHIVAIKDKRAASARAVLEFHGIDPNAALNGVWLKCKGTHRNLHTNAYYANLNRVTTGGRLLPKSFIEARMRYVAKALDDGVFPH